MMIVEMRAGKRTTSKTKRKMIEHCVLATLDVMRTNMKVHLFCIEFLLLLRLIGGCLIGSRHSEKHFDSMFSSGVV